MVNGRSVRMPREVMDFLRAPGGHSMIIKGDAGSGKTTFALQLIEELEGEQPEYYLSSRVSDEALFKQFPWLKEKVRRQEVMKAGKAFLRAKQCDPSETDSDQEGRVCTAKHFLKTLNRSSEEPMVVRSELKRLEGLIESGGLDFDDELDVNDDGLTINLGTILPELEIAYDIAEINLPQKTLVILDSIEGLSERYGISPKRIINVLQKDLVENSSTNVVYILETSEKTDLDYLGDGVIVFDNVEWNGRKLRHMRIDKLRGARIDRWMYNFTLDDGRFKAIDTESYPDIASISICPSEPDPDEDHVSWGGIESDSIFGGLPRGEVSLIEVGDDVNPQLVDFMEMEAILNSLSLGRGVVWFPGHSVDYELMKREIPRLAGPDALKHLAILDIQGVADPSLPFVRTIEGVDAGNDLNWQNLEYFLQGSDGPFLAVMGFDRLESVYGNSVLTRMMGHFDGIMRKGHVGLMISSHGSSSLPGLTRRARRHIRIDNVAGVPIMSGERPFTPYMFMRVEPSSGKVSLQTLI